MLQSFRIFQVEISSEVLPYVYSTMIPEDCHSVSDAFWDEYRKEERAIRYHACLLLWVLTKSMNLKTASLAESRTSEGLGSVN